MKTLLPIILIIIGSILFGLGLAKIYRIYQASEILKHERPMTNQQIVKFCQELFANTNRDDFSYLTCLEELKNADSEINTLEI